MGATAIDRDLLTASDLKYVSQTNLSDNCNTTADELDKETVRLMRVIASPIIILFGTLGNVLILFVMRKERLKKTSICFYMSLLAVTDTGKCAYSSYPEINISC